MTLSRGEWEYTCDVLAKAILFRGAGLAVVWPQFISLALIGAVLFTLSSARFCKTIGTMA